VYDVDWAVTQSPADSATAPDPGARSGPILVLEQPPFSRLPTVRQAGEISALAAPGEMVSLSFSVASTPPASSGSPVAVTVQVSDAAGNASTIPASQIEIHVVHTWAQAGLGLYQSQPQQVPELLLKSDHEPLVDAYRPTCGHPQHFFRREPNYRAPNVRLRGDVSVILQPGENRQFWVSIKTPASASPGVYAGVITIAADGTNSQASRQLPFRLEVLPIHLIEPPQDLFLWYKGTLDCRHPQHYVSPEVMRAQLKDIYDHGFTSLSLIEAAPEFLQQAIDIANETGFHRNALLEGPFDRRYRRLKFGNLRPIYYLSDKLDMPRFAFSARHHFRNWKFAQSAGGSSMCSMMQQSFSRRLLNERDIGHAPTIFNYYLPFNLDYFRVHAAFAEIRNHKTYYYWQCHMEKPNLHRVLAGLFLWRSKADGIAPYCYQHRPRSPNSAFNDFDEWEPGYLFGPEKRPFKDHMTTYPAATGSIPTLQWKGLSAGLYDLRYLVSLDAAMRTALRAGDDSLIRTATEIRGEIDRFLARIALQTINILDERDPEPYPDVHSEDYADFRRLLTQGLIDLQARLGEAA